MNFLTELYNLVTRTMEEPGNFGWFHLVCIAGITLLTTVICLAFKDCTDRAVRRISCIVWVIVLILEIYKQLIFGFGLEEGKFVWDYAWYAFPFQFCSSPLYILPVIAFTRSERVREACISYMMTFSLFAGLAVFCYPNDVFIETIGINLQTMIHHGSQIMMGIFYTVRYRNRFGKEFFFGGVKVFVVMAFIAMALNIGVYHMLVHFGIDETFNMFYISPYFDCTLPLLSMIYPMLPYVGFLCVYLFGFILCALIVYGIMSALVPAEVFVTHRLPTKSVRVNRRFANIN